MQDLISEKDKWRTVFLDVCSRALEWQDNSDGSMPAGHNGPYRDPETPVRNTSHWIISFAKAFELTNDERYLNASREAVEFLLNDRKFNYGYSYIQREKSGKDVINGVIGPAWVIEALVFAYKRFGDEEILSKAWNLQRIHDFNETLNLWHRCDPEGKTGRIDYTFNHQLWFAAASAVLNKLCNDDTISNQLTSFFDGIQFNLQTYPSGLIRHGILRRDTFSDRVKNFIRPAYGFYERLSSGKTMKYKEQGYHFFNLFAFAKIHKAGFHHSFFDGAGFGKMLSYGFSYELADSLLVNRDERDVTRLPENKNIPCNRYGYPYNAVGFEAPFVNDVFSLENDALVASFFEKQLELTYNFQEKLFVNSTEDPTTLNSRIYELAHIL